MTIYKITIKVGGMMCQHCQMHVKNALSALPDVTSVDVSLKEGTAEIHSKHPIEQSLIKDVITNADYEYLGILQ